MHRPLTEVPLIPPSVSPGTAKLLPPAYFPALPSSHLPILTPDYSHLTLRWGHYIPQKCWYVSTRKHGTISPKTAVLIFTPINNSDFMLLLQIFIPIRIHIKIVSAEFLHLLGLVLWVMME